MLQHTLKTIIRQLRRSPLFTSIHLLGLSIGLSAVLVIFLYIRQECSYDRSHTHADNVYRVTVTSEGPEGIDYSAGSPLPLAPALRDELPDLEAISGLFSQGEGVARVPGQDHQKVKEVLFTDEHFLALFDYDFRTAVKPEVLAEPGQVLLSASTAKSLFGTADPLGQIVELDGNYELTVAGVFADQRHSNLQPELLVSLATLPDELHGFELNSWGVTIGSVCYARLPDGQSAEQYAASLRAFADKYFDGTEEGVKNTIYLQPITDIHFDTRLSELTSIPAIDPIYLWVAGGVGLLILLMACFNFVNLSLAKQLQKSQVIGMQKVLGARSGHLWLQGWGEALLLSLLATIISLGVLQWALPQVEELLQREFIYDGFADGGVWLLLLAVMLFVSLVAGGYPAWVMAKKRPEAVLQSSKIVSNRGQARLRQAIVLAQFVITLLLISGALTVGQQLRYLQNQDLGFRQDAIIQIALPEPGLDEVLAHTWQQLPGVEAVSFGLGAPTSPSRLGTSYYPKGKNPQQHSTSVTLKTADENYAELYELELLAGRYLSAQDERIMEERLPLSGSEWPIVVNETLVRKLGYQQMDQALGQSIILSMNNAEGKIIGVVADYNISSLHETVPALVMTPIAPLYYEVGVRVKPGQLASVVDQLAASWRTHYPDKYFDYQFLDEAIAEQYLNESRTSKLLRGFAGLAIFVACLGLFGLTAIMVRQRRREIGLRKVLGASVVSIWLLLSRHLVVLLGIAILIATPLAWWGMQWWLNNFAYRITLGPWTILLAGVVLLLIALLTVSGQAIQAALRNPARALRDE